MAEYEMNGGENELNGDARTNLKDEERKLFVGGLSWETTEKELREYFSKYGDIESVNIKTDSNTGRSRGFSFIVFRTADSLDKVFEAGDHVINNKKVDPKKAKLRAGKIFVGGLSPELTDDDIKQHFSQFGTITLTEMPYDKVKNQRKGFCFITYESDQMVQEIVKNQKQMIKGKMVDVKKATPKPGENFLLRGRGRGRGGMRGAGRGGYPMAGYPMDYGAYGYDYYGYGYGPGYGYDYYGADPYGYGYDYSAGYGYDPASGGYPPPPAAPQAPAAPAAAPAQPQRGRGKPAAGKTRSGTGRGFRHTPY